MIRIATSASTLIILLGCSPNRPPPQVCENPPPEKRMHIGSCPISTPNEAPMDAGDAMMDTDAIGADAASETSAPSPPPPPTKSMGYHSTR